MLDFLSAASDDTAVWIDVIAVNQHRDLRAAENSADVAAFSQVVEFCKAGTLVIVDMQRMNPAKRAWCLYEWDHTLRCHGPDGLHFHGLSLEDRSTIVGDIDIEKAECLHPGDKKMITRGVIEHHQSTTAFDNTLKLQLLLSPVSHKVDLQQLGQRSSGTAWDWTAVKQWMDGDGKDSRALCVLAGAGTGKSSISAAMLDDEVLGPCAAAHFLKYSDQRRLEPVAIIKNLAFQLAYR